MKIDVYFDSKPWSGETAVYFVMEDVRGIRRVCKPMEMVFETDDDRGKKTEPSLLFSAEEKALGVLNAFADGLSRAGFRPKNDDTKELAATKQHLEDMRRLVDHMNGGGVIR